MVQGALAVECRDSDLETLELLSHLHHKETVLATIAERSFMKTLGMLIMLNLLNNISFRGWLQCSCRRDN